MTSEEVEEIRNHHASIDQFKHLSDMPREELIRFAITEMNAKNKVYYFILESGLLQMYIDYTRGTKQTGTA